MLLKNQLLSLQELWSFWWVNHRRINYTCQKQVFVAYLSTQKYFCCRRKQSQGSGVVTGEQYSQELTVNTNHSFPECAVLLLTCFPAWNILLSLLFLFQSSLQALSTLAPSPLYPLAQDRKLAISSTPTTHCSSSSQKLSYDFCFFKPSLSLVSRV